MSSNSEWTKILSDSIEKSVMETLGSSTTNSTTAATDSNITADELIVKMNDAMKTLGFPPVDPSRKVLDQIRSRREYIESVERENEAIQRKWDKEFNSRVLDIVRKAIHRGLVQVMIQHQLDISHYEDEDCKTGPIKTIEVRYDKYRKDAYRHVREQAENAVRASMRPPNLRRLP